MHRQLRPRLHTRLPRCSSVAEPVVTKQQQQVRKGKVVRMMANELQHEYEDLSLDMVRHQLSITTIGSIKSEGSQIMMA